MLWTNSSLLCTNKPLFWTLGRSILAFAGLLSADNFKIAPHPLMSGGNTFFYLGDGCLYGIGEVTFEWGNGGLPEVHHHSQNCTYLNNMCMAKKTTLSDTAKSPDNEMVI